MSNPRIEVEFVAKVDGLSDGVNKATGQLDKLGKAAQTTAPKVEQLGKATSRYNGIGLDFARVIQDAPFGIIGVGNNIQQLAQSFSSLGQSGDSTISKLKTAFSAIFSSGNLLILAVSALTSGLTYLTQKGFFNSEKGAKSLTDRLKDFEQTLGSVEKATLKGIQNSEGQLQKFRALTAQAENLNVSDKNRLAAVNELQKQYPEYLGNLTEEQILTGQVGDSYDILTKQIIANAKAKAFSDEITKNSSDLRTIEKEQNETANQILSKRIELQNAQATSNQSALKVSGQLAATDFNVSKIQSELNDLIQKQIKSVGEANKIKQSNLELDGLINEELKNGAVFTNKNTESRDKNTKALEEWKKKAEEIQAILDTEAFLESREIKFDLNVEKFTKQIKEAFPEEKEVKIKINTDIQIEPETADQLPFEDQLIQALNPKRFTEFEQRTAEFATNIRDLLQNNVTDAFIDLGYTIGETLATGGNVLKAIGGSILKSFARFLGQFGEQLIAYGVAATAFGKVSLALATPGGALIAAPLAIAAGIALTAIAGAIGSMGSKGPGGGGGGAGGGSAAPAGSSFTGGGVGGLFDQNRDVSGEFVVRGNDLVYVLGQANNKINKG